VTARCFGGSPTRSPFNKNSRLPDARVQVKHMIAAPSRQRRETMDHSATIRRMYELLSAGDVDGFADVLADDFVEHEDLPGGGSTKEGTKAFFEGFLAGFPDTQVAPDDVLSSGDKVVARSTLTGTNSGPFMGMPATGKTIKVQLIDIIRFGDDGLAHEHWGILDSMAMMQQLGVVPAGPPA
jgi:steroid delta-isomerase-like uncharacterized protein